MTYLPRLNLLKSNETHKSIALSLSMQIMKIYKLIIPVILLFVVGCGNNQPKSSAEETSAKAELFFGKVTYTTKFESPDTNLLQTVRPFSPEKTEIWFAENKFRMIEHGGASKGNILVFTDKKEAWQIDTTDKIAYLGEYSDFDDPGEELMDMMPDHFAPTLEAVHETETIQGFSCEKFKVIRSGFIPGADEAFVWITNEIRFPPSRYDVQTDINHVTVPLPLYLGYNDGVILKMRIANKRYAAVYEIIEMNKSISDQHVFSIPEGFAKK